MSQGFCLSPFGFESRHQHHRRREPRRFAAIFYAVWSGAELSFQMECDLQIADLRVADMHHPAKPL